MSVTVEKVFIPKTFRINESGRLYTFEEDSFPIIDLSRGDKFIRMAVAFYRGFKSDGASVPFPFSLFVKRYRRGDDRYNIAPFVHDALYATKGMGQFTREECDDILRGCWRESGMGRFVAGVADKAVEFIAGSGRHWGNDEYGAAKHFNFVLMNVP